MMRGRYFLNKKQWDGVDKPKPTWQLILGYSLIVIGTIILLLSTPAQ